MKRLVLVGGGHAHVEVLRQMARRRFADTNVLLISAGRYTAYTGMVPGYLAGRYSAADVRFDLAAIAATAGAEFLDATVDDVDGEARTLRVGARRITFDACSLDVGSAPAGARVPGVAAHALPLRPLANALVLRERFSEMTRAPRGSAHCIVVGGGAGGVEVALSLAEFGNGAVPVTLVHAEEELLSGYPARARRLVAEACARARITVRTSRTVASVTADRVVLSGGEQLSSSLTVWLAGAAPPPLLADSRLPLSEAGYFEVDATLRATDGSPVWGAGDCITLRDHAQVPKAGVFAVRQGPVLAHNLRAFCEGVGNVTRYRPQPEFLSLLSLRHDRALLSYYGVALTSPWAQRLKEQIDRGFMARYRAAQDVRCRSVPLTVVALEGRTRWNPGRLVVDQTRGATRTSGDAIANAADRHSNEAFEALLASLIALAWIVEARDPYTGGHLWRVSQYSQMLAQAAELSAAEVARVAVGALLHDVGKIGVPDAVLCKREPLTPKEYEVIQTHPLVGARILSGHPLGDLVSDMVLLHHERPDGRGYPFRRTLEQTPVAARIVAVCDAFDAMTSRRPFRSGLPVAKALEVLEEQAGSQFDAALCARFVELGQAGMLAHVLGHADDGIPLQSCPTCGPTLVIRREQAVGEHVVCPNCASDFELVASDDGPRAVPTGRHGSAVELAPAPDNALIGRLVAKAVRALPVAEWQHWWSGSTS